MKSFARNMIQRHNQLWYWEQTRNTDTNMDIQDPSILETNEEQFTLTNGDMAGCDRRYKVLPMSPDLVFSMVFNCLSGRDKECFSQVSTLILEGLPADVKIEGISYDPQWNVILLRLYSSIWPIVEGQDIPILKWDMDIKLTTKKMLLQPYTNFDLLEMVNEARSKMGLDHITFNHSDRPVWLKDILLMENDIPPESEVTFNPSDASIPDMIHGEVGITKKDMLLKMIQQFGQYRFRQGSTEDMDVRHDMDDISDSLLAQIQEQLG